VQFPGYVAGAVDAANIGTEQYLKRVKVCFVMADT
jgi:hypothetical protein